MIREEKGFSLVEVLIGVILLAIGLLAICGLQVTSVRGNFFSNNLSQATYVAQDRLEFLKNRAFTHVDLTAGVDKSDGTTTIPGSTIVFNRKYTVIDNTVDRKTITYTVTWDDGVGHSIAFSTIRIR